MQDNHSSSIDESQPAIPLSSPGLITGREALKIAGIGVWEWDLKSDRARLDDNFFELYGLTPQQIAFEDYVALVHPDDRGSLRESITRALAQNESYTHTHRITHSSGQLRTHQIKAQIRRNSEQRPCKVVGTIMDITDLINPNTAPAGKTHHYRTLETHLPDIILRIDPHFRIRYANPALSRLTGIPEDYFIGRSALQMGLADAGGLLWQAQIQKVIASGKPLEIENCYSHNLDQRYFKTLYVPEMSLTGEVLSIISTSRDITHQKRSDEFVRIQHDLAVALAASDNLNHSLELILDAALKVEGIDCGGVYFSDNSGRPRSLTIYRGISSELAASVIADQPDSRMVAMLHRGQALYLTPQEATALTPALRQEPSISYLAIIPVIHDGQLMATFNLASKKSAYLDQQVRDQLEIIAGQTGPVISRIKAQQEREEANQQFLDLYRFLRRISDNIPDPIWAKDHENRYLFANQALCDTILKCSHPKEAIGRNSSEFAAAEIKAGHQHTFGHRCANSDVITLKRGKAGRFFEDGLIRGQYVAMDVHKAPLLDKGQIIGTVGSARDITTLKRTENALKRAQEELEQRVIERTRELELTNQNLRAEIEHRIAIEQDLAIKESALASSITPFSIADPKGVIFYANQALFDLTGFDQHEIIGQPGTALFDEVPFKEAVKRLVRDDSWIGELLMKRRGDSICIVRVMANIVRNEKGVPICTIGSFVDMTQINTLQEQLLNTERLAATGQLAASVAHEINSPLQGIRALLNVIELTHENDQELLENLSVIKNSFNSIRDTVKKLLDLNRPGKEIKQPTDINHCIKDTAHLVRSLLKQQHIDLKLELDPTLPEIIASPQQMQQILMNLINNSMDAISELTNGEPSHIKIRSYRDDDRLAMAIEDNGPGIPENAMRHIFDPFYTSKKALGMGVGLSICSNIIKDHHGQITVENAAPHGARFTIKLPMEEL